MLISIARTHAAQSTSSIDAHRTVHAGVVHQHVNAAERRDRFVAPDARTSDSVGHVGACVSTRWSTVAQALATLVARLRRAPR